MGLQQGIEVRPLPLRPIPVAAPTLNCPSPKVPQPQPLFPAAVEGIPVLRD